MSSDYSHETEEEEEEESLEEESLEESKNSGNSEEEKYDKEDKDEEKDDDKNDDKDEDKDDDKDYEKDDDMGEEREDMEEPVNIPEENRLYLSLALIKKFLESENDDSDEKIIEYLLNNGLPMEFKDMKELEIYLYFHKMSVPFYKIFASMKTKDNLDITLATLKENYYLLVNSTINHFNHKNISQKVYNSLTLSKEPITSKIPIGYSDENSNITNYIKITKFILELGLKARGRLDIYVKVHIAKAIINYINDEDLLSYIKFFQQMEDDFIRTYNTWQKDKLSTENYEDMVSIFINGEMRNEWSKLLNKCKQLLVLFQNLGDNDSILILEKLFIQLLGHFDIEVRNYSVKMLNMIYDETTWQEKSAYKNENIQIKTINEKLNIELSIKESDYSNKSIVLIISSPSQNKDIKNNVMTFLKCLKEEKKNNNMKLTFPIGKLKKCGFYDWYLVHFSKGKFTNLKIYNKSLKKFIDGKGRIIVQPKEIKKLSMHEVFCDIINANIDKSTKKILKRGNFATLKNKLDEYHKRNINCVYIMGALERDNGISYDEKTGEVLDIASEEASPMATTTRTRISSLLGGEKEFKALMEKASKSHIKIIIDFVANVSSSKANRKYRNILLKYLDSKGRMQNMNNNDISLLNYRKIETWNLLIEEIKAIAEKYNINGIHIDNCQLLPQIMEVDSAELSRIDSDGSTAYTHSDIINGEIVVPNTEKGYWDTENCDYYANPFLVKLTKSLWNDFPNFIFVGECWQNDKSEKRHINLIKSGVIPKMYNLPMNIAQIFGKRLYQNGNIELIQYCNANILKDWYKENYEKLPTGSTIIQSSCAQSWPYPVVLYSQGTLNAIDLLFTLPPIPMSLMEEINGETHRVEIENVYEKREIMNNLSGKSMKRIKSRSKSLLKVIESKEKELKEKDNKNEDEFSKLSRSSSSTNTNEFNPQYNLQESMSALVNMAGLTSNQKQNDPNLKNISMSNYENDLMQDINYDLSEIKAHFDQKRKLRSEHECLRDGKLIFLDTYDERGQNNANGIFAFARKTEKETGIFIFNFKDKEINFTLDMAPLIGKLKDNNPNSICNIENWSVSEKKVELYFLKELAQGFANQTIEPYSSLCYGFSTLPYTQENYRKTLENKTNRDKDKENEKKKKIKNAPKPKRISVPTNPEIMNSKSSNDIRENLNENKIENQINKNVINNNMNNNINNNINNNLTNSYLNIKTEEVYDPNFVLQNNNNYRMVTGEYNNRSGMHLSSDKLSKQLREILTQKLSLRDFSDWFNSVIISMQTDDLSNFISSLSCLKENEELSAEFFKYCYNLSKSKNRGYKYTLEAEKLYNSNQLGIICFITPELGRWSTVGGLGIMVDELSQGLRSLGQDVIMISPYYYQNRKGQTDYLKNDPFNIQFLKNISINLDRNCTCQIYYGEGNEGIKYYFIENKELFPKVYPNFNTPDTLREIAVFAKCSLQLLKDLNYIPSIVLTNDWFTGLVPAYGKNNAFGDTYKNTVFMHICHNLEAPYEGRLYFNGSETYQNIYNFNPDWLIDPKSRSVINPSRCAILKSDQWATVSRSYKKDLQAFSSLSEILNQKPNPFAFPNGVFIKKRQQQLRERTGGNKMECKKYIQLNYFGYNTPDYSVPIFSFVGRLTQQKGVLMIIDLVEELIRKTNGKINILVGGTGILNEGYVQTCIQKANYLRGKYPYCFWANPTEFFTDGPKINLGSDFGLMPSQFEPGGIVQHEFFLGGTPVVAYKTGGLKDTVFEFNWQTNTGNGITFENYTHQELQNAILRAIDLFNNKEKYDICCKNAYKSTIDVYDVSKAWCKEFHRLKNKAFLNQSEIQDLYMSQIPDKYLIINTRQNNLSSSNLNNEPNIMHANTFSNNAGKRFSVNYYDLNSSQSGQRLLDSINQQRSNAPNQYNKSNSGGGNKYYTVMGNDEVVKTFTYIFQGRQPNTVEISGSFDNWAKKHRLIHKTRENRYELSMKLKKGKYFYKYIIDGNWEINPNENQMRGNDGIVNNVIDV